MSKGYIQIYTGDGKGKTTAAFGLAVRARYAGKRVYIGQLMKSMKYNEVNIEKDVSNITIEQLGTGCIFNRNPNEEDINSAREGLMKCSKILKEGNFDLVILDEIMIAIYLKLISTKEVIKALDSRAEHVEVVLTGRYAPKELIEKADLVTEMKQIKHYYEKGVEAREGIERWCSNCEISVSWYFGGRII